MSAAAAVVQREPASNFCGRCKRWVVSLEKVDLFERPRVWFCPECRGEAAPGTAKVVDGPRTQASVSQDERKGPQRTIVRGSVVPDANGVTGWADLDCGHRARVFVRATRARCKSCRPRADGNFEKTERKED